MSSTGLPRDMSGILTELTVNCQFRLARSVRYRAARYLHDVSPGAEQYKVIHAIGIIQESGPLRIRP